MGQLMVSSYLKNWNEFGAENLMTGVYQYCHATHQSHLMAERFGFLANSQVSRRMNAEASYCIKLE